MTTMAGWIGGRRLRRRWVGQDERRTTATAGWLVGFEADDYDIGGLVRMGGGRRRRLIGWLNLRRTTATEGWRRTMATACWLVGFEADDCDRRLEADDGDGLLAGWL